MRATKLDLQNSIQLLEKSLVALRDKAQAQSELIKTLSVENEALKIKNLALEDVSQKDLEDYLVVVNTLLFSLDNISGD